MRCMKVHPVKDDDCGQSAEFQILIMQCLHIHSRLLISDRFIPHTSVLLTMMEFPEASQIAEMVDQEKGATPQDSSLNFDSRARSKRRAALKAAKKKGKHHTSGSNGKERAIPDDFDESYLSEDLDSVHNDDHFKHWLGTGAKSSRKCKLIEAQSSIILLKFT